MIDIYLFKNLTLFGEGGDGGAGAAPAAGPADGAQAAAPEMEAPKPRKSRWSSRLEGVEYGVPHDDGAAKQAASGMPTQSKAGASDPMAGASNPPYSGELTWEEVSKRFEREINQAKEAAVKERFKSQTAEKAVASRQEKALRKLAGDKYGLADKADGSLDLDALEKAMKEDDDLIAEKAAEMGVSNETYRLVEGYKEELAEVKAQRDQMLAEKQAQEQDMVQRAQFEQMMRQAEEAKKLFPNLDVMQELNDPSFARLIRAGVPVQTAYQVQHMHELVPQAMQAAAQDAAMNVSRSVQANQRRPVENGLGKKAPASVRVFDPKTLTREQRRDIRDRVNRGEKIYWD